MIEEKIKALGYDLPKAPKPLAAYIPAIRVDNLIFTAGQLPMVEGKLISEGNLPFMEEGMERSIPQIEDRRCITWHTLDD